MLGWFEIWAVAMVFMLLGFDIAALLWVTYAAVGGIPEENAGMAALVLFVILILRRLLRTTMPSEGKGL